MAEVGSVLAEAEEAPSAVAVHGAEVPVEVVVLDQVGKISHSLILEQSKIVDLNTATIISFFFNFCYRPPGFEKHLNSI